MAKAKLGSNFTIVDRRRVTHKNLLSLLSMNKLGGDSEVELEVAINPLPDKEAPAKVKTDGPIHPLLKTYAKAESLAEQSRKMVASQRLAPAELGETSHGLAGHLQDIKHVMTEVTRDNREFRDEINRDYREMRNEMHRLFSLQGRGGLPKVGPELLKLYQILVDDDVDSEVARELVENLDLDEKVLSEGTIALHNALTREIAKRIPVAGPILLREDGPTVVAFIGPTGVGKSTTVAKLAVDFSLRGRQVGLINEDRSRPAADYQLKNLGQIMTMPAETASSPEDMRHLIESMSDLDLILIDTGGRSPRDKSGLDELADMLEAAKPDETHLVLASVTASRNIADITERFRPLNFNRLILSKLDEIPSYGTLLTLAAALGDGISYVTTGQKYKDSFLTAESAPLAGLVTGTYILVNGRLQVAGRDRNGGDLSC
ncbi:MAG: hypothetical protein LBU79_07455 [Planctomycetota bacterium]|nr:hypothetical protein [Planctomycetota bacterium]